MKVTGSLGASWSAVALAGLMQACVNTPAGQPETPKPAAAAPTPTRSHYSPPTSSPGRGSAAEGTAQHSAGNAPSVNPAQGTISASPTTAAQPEPAGQSSVQVQLAEGIRLFDQGEFYAAAGKLRSLPDLSSAPINTQTNALKYLAFSYCVTNRRVPCQQEFERVLKLDPKFELAPAERGHPIWKVVFERAKAAQQNASPVKAQDAKAAPAKAQDAKAAPVKAQDAKYPAPSTDPVVASAKGQLPKAKPAASSQPKAESASSTAKAQNSGQQTTRNKGPVDKKGQVPPYEPLQNKPQ